MEERRQQTIEEQRMNPTEEKWNRQILDHLDNQDQVIHDIKNSPNKIHVKPF